MKFNWMRVGSLLAVLGLSVAVGPVSAGDPEQPAKQIDLFDGIKNGDIEVQVIAKDANGGNVIIKNNGKQPLAIRLPEVVAAVPAGVLAQFGGLGGGGLGGGGLGGGGLGGGGLGGGQQGLGGGLGGGGLGGGGLGGGGGGFGGQGGGGFFNVGPEKIGKIKLNSVCLEHGKKDPNTRVPYALLPIEKFTQNESLIEVCKMLARGEVSKNAAQAAAWHLNSGLSWQELAAKDRVKHLNGTTEKWFSHADLGLAVRATAEANRRAETNKKSTPSLSEQKSSSLSQK